MSTPQIIHTVEELEALDPETVLMSDYDETTWSIMYWADWVGDAKGFPDETFPLVILATGAQVRAARKALEEENE